MAVFPSGFDSFPTLVDNVDDVTAAEPNNRGSAIVAVETKVGLDNSAVTSSLDYLMKSASSINPGHKHPESKITFSTVGGHQHRGVNSTKIKRIDVNFQDLITDNLNQSTITQCGWSFATPDETGIGTKAIVFPEAFNAVPYYINAFAYGVKVSTDPTSRTDCVYAYYNYYEKIYLNALSSSGVTIELKGGQNIRMLFFWTAIGPVA